MVTGRQEQVRCLRAYIWCSAKIVLDIGIDGTKGERFPFSPVHGIQITIYDGIAPGPEDDQTAANHERSTLDARFESIKWYLWHGNAFRALQEIQEVQFELADYEEELPASTKLAKSVREPSRLHRGESALHSQLRRALPLWRADRNRLC